MLVVSAATIANLPQWRLGPDPMRIGEGDAGREYVLDLAGMPWRMGDGDIVVPNAQSEIRWYDSTGKYVRTVGRRGRGPGDFEGLWNVQPVEGDTILAIDRPRVSVLDSSGKFVRSYPPPRATFPIGVRLIGDRAMVTTRRGRQPERMHRGDTGVFLDTMTLVVSTPDGVEDTIAQIKGYWEQATRFGDWREVILAGDPLLSTGRDEIVVAHGDDFELRWLDRHGNILRASRVAIPKVPVPRAMIQDHERKMAEEYKIYPPERGVPVPFAYATHLPMLTRVAVDRTGRTWVRRWVPDDATEAEWVIFQTDGQPLARIMMPAGFAFADAGDEYVLGRHIDPDGVQSIRRYTIVR